MRKRTITQKLQQVITKNLLIVEKVETYHKSTHQTNEITADTFKDSLDFLSETIFSDSIGWHYERNFKARGYILDSGAMNPYSENVVTVYLRVADDVSEEDIEKILKIEEE